MSAVVFGVGVGLIILLATWFTVLFIAVISFRTQRNLGSIALAIAVVVTTILLLIPLESRTPAPKVHKVYDELFIWRTSLLILLAISSAAGLLSYVSHCMEPSLAQTIK